MKLRTRLSNGGGNTATTNLGESQVMTEPLQRLRSDADKCRELASTAITVAAKDVLSGLADQYEREAMTLECAGFITRPRRPAFRWPLA